MRRPRRAAPALTALAVLVVAVVAGVLVLTQRGATPAAAQAQPQGSCGPGYAASVRSWQHTRDALFDASHGSRVVAFLGDSYTQGVALDRLDQDYAVVAARTLGWRPWLAGRGGTGYLSGGPCHARAAYGTRIADALLPHPQVVVVQGSINDWRSRPADVRVAAEALYRELAAAAPGVRIVVLGPCHVPKIARARIDALSAALRQAARAAQVTYVDSRDWIAAPGLVIPDGMHPTIAGHAEIGRRLAAALRA